jgi:hypothetical protein
VQTAAEAGRTVYVHPDSVHRRPVLGRSGQHIGVTFVPDHDVLQQFDALWSTSGDRHDVNLRSLPWESTNDVLYANRADSVQSAPWFADYLHGGTGPVFVIGHGLADWLVTEVGAGTTVWDGQFAVRAGTLQSYLDGDTAWRLLHHVRTFQSLLASKPYASIAGIICHVAAGRWSDAFVAAMRREGYTNEGHFAHDQVIAAVHPAGPAVAVAHNAGYDTYLAPDAYGYTERIWSYGARYSPDEISRHEQR